jgi:hypothetical protein
MRGADEGGLAVPVKNDAMILRERAPGWIAPGASAQRRSQSDRLIECVSRNLINVSGQVVCPDPEPGTLTQLGC